VNTLSIIIGLVVILSLASFFLQHISVVMNSSPVIPQPQPLYPSVPPPQSNSSKIGKKINVSFWLAIVFVVLSTPLAYKATNALLFTFMSNPMDVVSELGCPTTKGIVVHTVVFFIVAFVMLRDV